MSKKPPANLRKPKEVSNNMGWHTEVIPGQGVKRVSHNPRLIDMHPEIAAQWHPTLNEKSKTPETVTAESTYRAFWLCDAGHVWRRQVSRRTNHDSDCSLCKMETRSLAVRYPDIAKQLSPEKIDFDPRRESYYSTRLAWWTCSIKGHADYQRTICNRTSKSKPLGCPICEGTRPDKSQSVGALFPKLRKEWHPKLNDKLSPFDFTPGSMVLIWWRCSQNEKHEWPASIHNRTRYSECPFCRLWFVTDENRLSTCFPEIAAEWNLKRNRFLWPKVEGSFKVAHNLRIPPQLRNKNRRLRPSDVAINSDEVFWWKCKSHGHEWSASVEERAILGKACPECDKAKFINHESLGAKIPALTNLWHPTRNLPLLPTDVLPGSRTVVTWRCSKSATHVWEAPVYSVVRAWKNGNTGCRWCFGLSADEKNSLQSKCPQVANLWHPTANQQLLPSQVTFKSNKTVWWHCGKPGHEFESKVCNMVGAFERGGNGCKFCGGHAVAPDNCLKTTHPEVAKMWHPGKNGKLTASDVTKGSSAVVFWKCKTGHTWPAKISAVVLSHKLNSAAKGCPYCSGRKRS